MDREVLQRLFEHMWWADAQVGTAISTAAQPPARAVELYTHVLAAELVWLDRVEQTTPSLPVWPTTGVEGCLQLVSASQQRYKAFLDALSLDDLQRQVHYSNSAGQAFDSRLDDVLLHVALHGAYHRGQITMLLRDAGAQPAPTDYIGFVRGVPAATRRPAGC